MWEGALQWKDRNASRWWAATPGRPQRPGAGPGRVTVWAGREMIAVADYILLPLPLDAARTPLAELLRAARPGTLALGGMLSVEAKAIAAEAGVELVDYFAREELTIRNAIPTAEGCIGILMKERSRTLWGSSILLTGFGPVGQALASGWRRWERR